MKRTRIYVILGILVVVALVGGVVWRARQARQLEQLETRSVVVERGAMLVAISASGGI